MKTILIAGGTGLVGSHLCPFLRKQGYEVRLLSRHPDKVRDYSAYRWDVGTRQIDRAALEGVDAVINLAGAGIADRPWTSARKRELITSRVDATLLLRDALAELKVKPRRYIAASAIGYYGNRADEWVDEDSHRGTHGFLTELAVAWEAAAQQIEALGIATARLRIGIVLAREGGALKPLALPGLFGMAPWFGNGRQWYSWIHVTDLVRMIHYLLTRPTLTGPWNGVSPSPVRLKDFVKTIARTRRGLALGMPVPAWLLRLGMGEMADTVLYSTRVRPRRWLEETDFRWLFPELEGALEDLLRAPRKVPAGFGLLRRSE